MILDMHEVNEVINGGKNEKILIEKVNDYWINGIERSLEVVASRDKIMVFVMPLDAWNKIKEYSKEFISKLSKGDKK